MRLPFPEHTTQSPAASSPNCTVSGEHAHLGRATPPPLARRSSVDAPHVLVLSSCTAYGLASPPRCVSDCRSRRASPLPPTGKRAHVFFASTLTPPSPKRSVPKLTLPARQTRLQLPVAATADRSLPASSHPRPSRSRSTQYVSAGLVPHKSAPPPLHLLKLARYGSRASYPPPSAHHRLRHRFSSHSAHDGDPRESKKRKNEARKYGEGTMRYGRWKIERSGDRDDGEEEQRREGCDMEEGT
ncbi:hypothetical protein DFH06DRAFT_1351657 [Mycena polygramma]|nr:hypothetical protein DFH06DRAFT_1351657 [Mycena polygramma]